MTLDAQQQMLIEQRVTNDAKSTGAAYLLWFFLGLIGAHRFYLGRVGTGILQLLLFGIGWLTMFIIVGFLFLGIVGLWWLIDAFLIPGMIRADKEQIRRRLTADALAMSRG